MKWLDIRMFGASRGLPIQLGVLGIYQGMIEPNYEILDVGCGHKLLTRYLLCKRLVGIDIFEDYLSKNDIHGDITKLDELVPKKSFDCIFCLDVIEHLTTEDGLKLIRDMEAIARKKIIIFTPTKWSENEEGVMDPKLWSYGNKYNYHKSLWSEKQFLELGFIRLKTIYDKDYIIAVKEV